MTLHGHCYLQLKLLFSASPIRRAGKIRIGYCWGFSFFLAVSLRHKLDARLQPAFGRPSVCIQGLPLPTFPPRRSPAFLALLARLP